MQEKFGVVFELRINEDEYVVDAFHLDMDRIINNVIETKKINDLEKRAGIILALIRKNIKKLHTEEHRTMILNYLACMDWLGDELSKYVNQSMGICLMVGPPAKKTKIEFSVMNWIDFEKFLKELPPEVF